MPPGLHSAPKHLLVVGAGAAGMFAAIEARRSNPSLQVTVLEAMHKPLGKVLISGGGRCNVTHACFEPGLLVGYYPRGGRSLRGLLGRFGPAEVMAWYEAEGVALKIESDGRVFPVSDRSESIVDCLLAAARDCGVRLLTRQALRSCTRDESGFTVQTEQGSFRSTSLLLATGSSSVGHAVARSLGHSIVEPVPSLFTFRTSDPSWHALAGVSVALTTAVLSLPGESDVEQQGPLLFTHWGLSGPVVLRLSAWGARLLARSHYKATVRVDLLPGMNQELVRQTLLNHKQGFARKRIATDSPFAEISRRLWEQLLRGSDIDPTTPWSQLAKARLEALLENLKRCRFEVTGKGPFKEEFVTAGGVDNAEVDFKTMQSKVCPDLYLAGEILDVDALTGGFNFQHAWSSGHTVGRAHAPLD